MELNEMIRWVVGRGLALTVGIAVLLVIYRLARPAVHRAVPAFLHAQAQHLPTGSVPGDEMDKRAATIEDLLDKLLRAFVIAGLIALVLAVFDLWAILGGLVLIIAAVMVASQDVVLDYVMGFLILVEGPYFKGDWITVGALPGGIQGEVQEVGLRRTVLRDSTGSMNAVSNGLIRASANVTRVYSVALVDVQILRATDVERAITIALGVVHDMQQDATWSDRLQVDGQPEFWVTGMTIEGAALRLQNRVAPGAGTAVASELRRRLIGALAAESIGTARWDTPLPVMSDPVALGLDPTA